MDPVQDSSDSGGGLFCDPHRWLHKYILLFVLCFLTFGTYFCYDNPAALEADLIAAMHITYTQFGLYYTVYSFINVVVSIIGGFLTDVVFGLRLAAIVFASFCFVGHIIFATGTYLDMFWLQLVGRIVFALGGENLAVCGNTYAVRHFKETGKINMVFGFMITMARVGSFANMLGMPQIYSAVENSSSGDNAYHNLAYSFYIACIICGVSVLAAFALAGMDRRIARLMSWNDEKPPISFEEFKKLSKVKDFNLLFWILCGYCVFEYCAIFPFISLGQALYINKWGMSVSAADFVNSLPYIVSGVGSPIIGIIIDSTGYNIFWLVGATLLSFLAHFLVGFSFTSPYLSLTILGIAVSIVASALWPLVAYVVPSEMTATAYGVMQAVQNLGLALTPIIIGKVMDSIGFMVSEVIYLVLLCLALMTTALLYTCNLRQRMSLNLSAAKRKAMQHLIKNE